MKTKFVLWFGVFLFIMACEMPGPLMETTPTPQIPPTRVNEVPPTAASACISPEPTQEDVDRALSFTGKLFETGDWQRTYTVAENKVSVSWYSQALSSIAYLEALIFPCSYEEPDINAYFSDENWKVIFQNYQGYEPVDECRDDKGQRLYQFKVVSGDAGYDVNYWVKNDTDTRAISFMLVLPEGSDAISEYAYSLFPTLSSCK